MNFDDNITFLNTILQKLVLDPPEKLKKKGYEFLSLLKLKRGAGQLNLNDVCATVICLNLAAEALDCPFDKTQAMKVAGANKKNYASIYHTVKKVLDLEKPLTVNELCIKLEISEVAGLSQRLIDRYIHCRDEGVIKCPPIDLNNPVYACAAVLAACRHKKVKVKKGLLVEISRVKIKDLEKLSGELVLLAEQTDKQPSRKRGHNLIDLVEQMVKDSQNTVVFNNDQNEETDEKPQESFEEWKNRMLARAESTI